MFLWSKFREGWLNKFVSTKTQKSISVLMTGTVFATALPILFSPVMTRIYSTIDYGVLGLYSSISALIGVLAFVHYPQAIMLSKSDEEARQAMWFSISFCLGVAVLSLIVMLGLFLFNNFIDNSILGRWLLFIPLSVMLTGISSSILIWANRHQQYNILASNKILQAVLTVTIQIAVGLLVKNETGLIMGLLVGQLTSAFLLWYRFRNNIIASLGRPDSSIFRDIAFQHKKLLFYLTPSEFINSLINQTPVFLLQKFGGLSYVGSYNFTQRILGVPQLLLSSAVVDIFKQKASSSYNVEGNCKSIFIKTFKTLFALAVIPFLLIILLSPQLFPFVFGEEWRQAGEFAQFLGILYFLRFIISPLTYVYTIAGRYKEDFLLHIFFLVSTTVSFYIGNRFFEDKKYLILLYVIAYSSVYLIYLFRSYYLSKGYSNKR